MSDDPVGIQVGTGIATLVRKESHQSAEQPPIGVSCGEPASRRKAGPTSLLGWILQRYMGSVRPMAGLGLPFSPVAVSDDWFEWPSLLDLFPAYFPGVKTSRDSLVVDINLDAGSGSGSANSLKPADSDFIHYAYRPFDVPLALLVGKRPDYWIDRDLSIDRTCFPATWR